MTSGRAASFKLLAELPINHDQRPCIRHHGCRLSSFHCLLCTALDPALLPNFCRWDWDSLRSSIAQHGVRNSLLVAPMPTASTSQILGNNECFEPYTSNIYVRRVLSGEFTVVNQHLLSDLTALRMWNPDLKNELVAGNGSVQVRCGYTKVAERRIQQVQQRALSRHSHCNHVRSLCYWCTNSGRVASRGIGRVTLMCNIQLLTPVPASAAVAAGA